MVVPGDTYARKVEYAKLILTTLPSDSLMDYKSLLTQIAMYAKIDDNLKLSTKEKLSLIEEILNERNLNKPVLEEKPE